MIENIKHRLFKVRKASILTLGFICQEFDSYGHEIDRETSKKILNSFVITFGD